MKNPVNSNKIHLLSDVSIDKIDPSILEFLNQWKDQSDKITLTTSGSTGKPKTIQLKKDALINSAKATNTFFKLNKESIFLHCLPTKYIGGKMMLIRSLQANAKVVFSNSFSNPIKELNQIIDFCAMTPYQVRNSIKESIDKFKWIKTLIIGGGPIDNKLEGLIKKISTKCFHTFGMTETISHIALREISNSNLKKSFTCLPNISISTNENNQLIIDAKELFIEQLITNDIIELTDENSFIWIGRLDNVINSGGIKFHPENIEEKLHKKLSHIKFFIDKLPHKTLGDQLILICNHLIAEKKLDSIFSELNKYEIPKRIYYVNKFIYTENNKINRTKTKENAINLGKWYKPDL